MALRDWTIYYFYIYMYIYINFFFFFFGKPRILNIRATFRNRETPNSGGGGRRRRHGWHLASNGCRRWRALRELLEAKSLLSFLFWRNGVRTRLPSLRKIYPSLILLEKGASIQNGRAFFVLVHLAGKKGCFFLYFFYKKLEMDG